MTGVDAGGFEGVLQDVGLLDLLQVFHLGRRTVTLEIGGQHVQGVLGMVDGELVCARVDGEVGREALRRLLRAPGGRIRALPDSPAPGELRGSFDGLILDVLRELDEEARDRGPDAEGSPRVQRGFSVVPPPASHSAPPPSPAGSAGTSAPETLKPERTALMRRLADLDKSWPRLGNLRLAIALDVEGHTHRYPDPSPSVVASSSEMQPGGTRAL